MPVFDLQGKLFLVLLALVGASSATLCAQESSTSTAVAPTGQAPAPATPAANPGDAAGSSSAEALAKKLSNPVASLISVPFQNNFDYSLGPHQNGFRYTLNIQPVVPFSLTPKWNLISRTILPIIHQSDVVPGTSQTGLGDTVQSIFFSPNKTEPVIWGAGPALLIPTATDDYLGTGQFGLGPTVVVLKQSGHWTYGALVNHIWSVVGKEGRSDVSSTFFQPFASYTTKTAWTYALNMESTYDWVGSQWAIPVNATVAKLVRYGKQPVSYTAGLRCWATSPSGAPQGCGFRLAVTLLFPKKVISTQSSAGAQSS